MGMALSLGQEPVDIEANIYVGNSQVDASLIRPGTDREEQRHRVAKVASGCWKST